MCGLRLLVAQAVRQAADFGAVTKAEWETFAQTQRVDTSRRLQSALAKLEASIGRDVGNSLFAAFYAFLFALMRESSQRVIGVDVRPSLGQTWVSRWHSHSPQHALAAWSIAFTGRSPVGEDFVGYLQAHGKLKSVSNDVWTMTLQFAQQVSLGPKPERRLLGYDEAEACACGLLATSGRGLTRVLTGPAILDDYAAWVEAGRAAPAA
jgi:hypothetical protein